MSDRGIGGTDENQSGFVFEKTRAGDDEESENDRSDLPQREPHIDVRTDLLRGDNRTDTVVTIVVVVGLLLATASITYTATVPGREPEGDPVTFSLLTESGDGTLVASDYPTNFTRNESKPVVVAVSDGEQEPTGYTVVVELQRVRPSDSGVDTRVLEERELRRFHVSVPANETQYTAYNVTPTMDGENLQLVFLLYNGEPPADPSTANAYRELRLTVNVTTSLAVESDRSTVRLREQNGDRET